MHRGKTLTNSSVITIITAINTTNINTITIIAITTINIISMSSISIDSVNTMYSFGWLLLLFYEQYDVLLIRLRCVPLHFGDEPDCIDHQICECFNKAR